MPKRAIDSYFFILFIVELYVNDRLLLDRRAFIQQKILCLIRALPRILGAGAYIFHGTA